MSEPEFDSSPVDAWIGVRLGGGQMKDPVAPNDIRRWVQGIQKGRRARVRRRRDRTPDRDPAPNG